MVERNSSDGWLVAFLAMVVAATAATVLLYRTPERPAASLVASSTNVVAPPALQSQPAEVPSNAPRVEAPRPAGGARTAGEELPVPKPTNGWLQIPATGTNAKIVRVGLDKNGDMVTPRNAGDIAWLDNGSFPGPTRNAILAGHRNWQGRAGSLLRLEQAGAGDAVRIGLGGRAYTFTIIWVRTYDPDSAPVEELMGNTARDSITLVTCGGEFNPRTRHYVKRIVARAELVEVS